MHRCFVAAEHISSAKIEILDAVQIHHIQDVLYLEKGDEITACDEKHNEYLCSIRSISRKAVILDIEKKLTLRKAKAYSLAIACAIPKKAKMDEIVDKLTQLGVDRIIPLESERVVVRLDEKKKLHRCTRWQKIALEAAKQSQRNTVPVVEPVTDMEGAFVLAGGYDLKLIGALFGSRRSLKDVLSAQKYRSIIVFIGPEGDFSRQEVARAGECGCIGISLGELVLRVDTAALSVAAFINLYENG